MHRPNDSAESIFPICRRLTGEPLPHILPAAEIPAYFTLHAHRFPRYPFLSDLAALEYARHQLSSDPPPFPAHLTKRTVNPTVRILETAWAGLPAMLSDPSTIPKEQPSLVLLYRRDATAPVEILTPDGHDLLALKLVLENVTSRQAAAEAGVTIGFIDNILESAVGKGLLLSPPSSLLRDPSFLTGRFADPELSRVATFALQWHLTQACDLHCRHCYDRSARTTLNLAQALHVLDELYAFTQAHHIHAQISFSGGNPMLYPHFEEVYRQALDRGFLVAILGNPASEQAIERLTAIGRPEFYQVSLEGLREHNDYMRGSGHFDRTLVFLDLLRRYQVYSMVMLTLTRANADQVIPLARLLRGRADLFTFNRLAMVGEGAELVSLETDRFQQLLRDFLAEAEGQGHLSLKDNFFNLLLLEQNQPLTGGCTGFGCGAAFNFVSLLPDGEIHACRKFPSPIGNILSQSLTDIYFSATAQQYRSGSSACLGCELRPVCRGCAAVSHGFGLDIHAERDPYCFKNPSMDR